MKHEIDKPISIIHAEFIEQLVNVINNAQLPLFVIESVLKDIYNDVRILSKQQHEHDLKVYKSNEEAVAK